MKKTKNKSSKFLTGALVGTALGVATSVFANSKKGKKMIKEVKEKSEEFLEENEDLKKFADMAVASFKEARKKVLKKKGVSSKK